MSKSKKNRHSDVVKDLKDIMDVNKVNEKPMPQKVSDTHAESRKKVCRGIDIVAYLHDEFPAEVIKYYEFLQRKGHVAPYKDLYTEEELAHLCKSIAECYSSMKAQQTAQEMNRCDNTNESVDTDNTAENNTHNMEDETMKTNVNTKNAINNAAAAQFEELRDAFYSMPAEYQGGFMDYLNQVSDKFAAEISNDASDDVNENDVVAADQKSEAHMFTEEEVQDIVSNAVKIVCKTKEPKVDRKTKIIKTAKEVGKWTLISGAIAAGTGFCAVKAYGYIKDRRASSSSSSSGSLLLGNGNQEIPQIQMQTLPDGTQFVVATPVTEDDSIQEGSTVLAAGTYAMLNGTASL